MSEQVKALIQRFSAEFGGLPATLWAAPGRVNLIGEHTDYNAGYVLPLALEQCAYVAVRRRADTRVNLWSDGFGRVELPSKDIDPGAVSGWVAYVAGPAWALQQEGIPVPGFDLALMSEVPMGAGLSSSAAVECSTVSALAELVGAQLAPTRVAQLAQRAEVEMAGMPCGIMDQMVSVCARADHALFLDCRTLEMQHVPLGLQAQGLALIVIDTRAPHRLVEGAYATRRRACEEAAVVLGVPALRDAALADLDSQGQALGPERSKRARHVVTENARVLRAVAMLRAGVARDLGPLLDASHASLRDDFEVTTPELDLAAATAVATGALGARMIGGGFGGCVLALAPLDRVQAIMAATRDAFGLRGFRAPSAFTAVASSGARRVALA